eukprot:293036-Rhodomonas_salina.2
MLALRSWLFAVRDSVTACGDVRLSFFAWVHTVCGADAARGLLPPSTPSQSPQTWAMKLKEMHRLANAIRPLVRIRCGG